MVNLVVYVRHAESDANLIIHTSKSQRKLLTASQEDKLNSYHDPDITPTGVKQAEHTAIYLLGKIKQMNKKTVDIYVSPFKRAQDTAKPFIDYCVSDGGVAVNVSTINDLQEYTPTNKILTDEQRKIGMIFHEIYDAFIDRVMSFNEALKQELQKQDDDRILIIFGHSLFFSALMTYHIGHEKIRPTEISSLQMPNCSISCESYRPESLQWRTLVVSNVSHLPGEIATGTHVPFGII
jgi:broad specificity phosphatase PhoE